MTAANDCMTAQTDVEHLRAVIADAATALDDGCITGTAPDAGAAIAAARAILGPAGERGAPDYPVGALGPLEDSARAIANAGQVDVAMVGQTLLGAASLLTQGLANVEALAGPCPLSLFLLTLGESGSGKSTAQRVALQRVDEWQRAQSKAYRQALAEAEAEPKRSGRSGDEAVQPPRPPYRITKDATVEGLRRDLAEGFPAQGGFNDEAGAVLAGYGMSAEHRAKTATAFAGLWDRGHLSLSRAGSGRVERYGTRLSLHWLVQPSVAADVLADPTLSAAGFWPRFMVAWPADAPPRKAMPFRPDENAGIVAYWTRCDELLSRHVPDDCDEAVAIGLLPDARGVLERAFEGFEREAKVGTMRVIRPFALRAAEQAARVAGVLTAFAGQGSVDADTMRNAVLLTAYSLGTWHGLIDRAEADQSSAHALRLFQWLLGRPGWTDRLADITRIGPACVRSAARRDAAVGLLRDAGLIDVTGGMAVALDLSRRAAA